MSSGLHVYIQHPHFGFHFQRLHELAQDEVRHCKKSLAMKLQEQGYGLSPIFTQVERRTDMLSRADPAENHGLVVPTTAICRFTVLGTGVQDPGFTRVKIALQELGQTCLSLH